MRGREFTFNDFKKQILVKDDRDENGTPKHTRYVKKLFYKFRHELLREYNFNMRKCTICGIDDMWNGKPFMMELDHINRITNDSRIKNLRVLCPICHTQTDGYKNRTESIQDYHGKLVCHA